MTMPIVCASETGTRGGAEEIETLPGWELAEVELPVVVRTGASVG